MYDTIFLYVIESRNSFLIVLLWFKVKLSIYVKVKVIFYWRFFLRQWVVKYLVAKRSASSEVSRWLQPGCGRCCCRSLRSDTPGSSGRCSIELRRWRSLTPFLPDRHLISRSNDACCVAWNRSRWSPVGVGRRGQGAVQGCRFYSRMSAVRGWIHSRVCLIRGLRSGRRERKRCHVAQRKQWGLWGCCSIGLCWHRCGCWWVHSRGSPADGHGGAWRWQWVGARRWGAKRSGRGRQMGQVQQCVYILRGGEDCAQQSGLALVQYEKIC